MPIPEANSLFALATHLVGAAEFWVLALAGGRQIARDRDAEFRASGTYQELEVRYLRWLAEVRDVLSTLPDAASALHLGHIQLTRSLLASASPARPGS